jgi:HlyD family secretion protein
MRRRVGAAAALAVAVSLAGYLAFGLRSGDTALVASGTVEATTADVGFAVAGRIQELLVREGEPVTRGQLLARLDAADLEARAETMRAQAAAARAALAEAEEVAQARAGVRAAVRRLDDAGRDLDRALRLFEGGAISRESLDRAESVHDLAEAAVDQARQHLAILESGARPERIAAQRAGLEAAEAAARQAEVALDHASIRAPFDGRVTIRHREPGETVQPGQPVVTVTDPTDRWVRIFIPETRMGAVALGQDASIESDTFRGRAYAGRVTFIATEAEFTPRSIQTREERVKLVFAARVQIVGDTALELKPGMPADVRLHPSGLDGRPGI